MGPRWQTNAWEDYLHWQQVDKKMLKRINDLIKDMLGNSFSGIEKPEPLKNRFSDY